MKIGLNDLHALRQSEAMEFQDHVHAKTVRCMYGVTQF